MREGGDDDREAIGRSGQAMRAGSGVLQLATPLMRSLAERRRINVGLAAPGREEMVYPESLRYSRRSAFRKVVSGQRVPIELTSLGRAYLAATSAARREALLAAFHARQERRGDGGKAGGGASWSALLPAIEASMSGVRDKGYCIAS